jgi:hypothetical protein
MELDIEIFLRVQVRIWTTIGDNDVAVHSDWAFQTIPGCLAAVAHKCRLLTVFFSGSVGVQLAFSRTGC